MGVGGKGAAPSSPGPQPGHSSQESRAGAGQPGQAAGRPARAGAGLWGSTAQQDPHTELLRHAVERAPGPGELLPSHATVASLVLPRTAISHRAGDSPCTCPSGTRVPGQVAAALCTMAVRRGKSTALWEPSLAGGGVPQESDRRQSDIHPCEKAPRQAALGTQPTYSTLNSAHHPYGTQGHSPPTQHRAGPGRGTSHHRVFRQPLPRETTQTHAPLLSSFNGTHKTYPNPRKVPV